ncbi:type IV pilus modification PilV family protein [Syntrophomonas curvata]
MLKRNSSFGFHYENGFTLVEVLVAMVILLLIVTACFPLFTLATKTTNENRARLTANELAKRELERILAQVTPGSYISEDDDPDTAPLKTGVSATYYFDDNGKPIAIRDSRSRFARFEARKIVEWIDDPADGVHPADKTPFDYKVLIIEVSCPSQFTGQVVKQADFKTFVAREGAASPIVGVIIEVVRGWTDEYGNRIPLEGATVTLDGTGPRHMGMTNSSGQALIPITFPDDSTVYSYQVQTERLGMIPRPDQKALPVEARPYSTNYIQMEMEEPATLTLRFAPSEKDVDIALDGGLIMGGPKEETLIAGNSRVTFANLWPAGKDPDHPGRVCSGGTYSLTMEKPLLAYNALPEAGLEYPADRYPVDPDDPSPPVLNLWNYEPSYNGNPAWVASAAAPNTNPESPHRLAFSKLPESEPFEPEIIDMRPFKPVLAGVTARLTASFTEFSLSGLGAPLPDDFNLVYLGKEEAALDSDNSDDWTPCIKIHKDPVSGERVLLYENGNTLAIESSDQLTIPADTELGLKEEYFSKSFKMRFDSSPYINTLFFRNFSIRCTYDNLPSIEFTGPGQNRNIVISGN